MSGLLHGLFALAFLATASGTLPRGAADPFGEGEAIEVSLTGAGGAVAARAAAPGAQPAEPLETLARRLRAEQSDRVAIEREPLRPSGGLSPLMKALGQFRPAGKPGPAARPVTAARAGLASPDDGSAGLLGQVTPCWRRLAPAGATPVTLEVDLDSRGRLSAPPRLLRPAGARPDEPRLLAEAAALAAIQACLPWRQAGAGQSWRVTLAGR